jgi:hypothetical protein
MANRLNLPLLLFLVAGILVALGVLLYPHLLSVPPVLECQPVVDLRATTCWKQTLQLLPDAPRTVGEIGNISSLCYQERGNEINLENDLIKRQAFLEQHFVGRVMLWLVVAITISGVVLAALQLLAGYRLAAAGRGMDTSESSLNLEMGKVSVKSSITGLLILVVSFAFFLVFVDRVYTIHEIGAKKAEDAKSEPTSKSPSSTTMKRQKLESIPVYDDPANGPGSAPKAPEKKAEISGKGAKK